MRRLSRIRRLGTLALVVGTMAACALANTPSDWQSWDLGAIRLHTPAAMQLKAGGIDSQAGMLTSEGLRIEYDFGLYSDPLTRRDDMLDYRSTDGTVDGRAARIVHFRLTGTAATTLRACSGVHVPAVRRSSMGALSLTVLACAASADDLKDAPDIFRSIRFQGSAARP